MALDFARSELDPFLKKSNLAGFRALAVTWGIIFLSFAMVAYWPNPLTVIVAIIFIGGRQLALGVMMHDCGHQALFKSKWLNDHLGQWFCASPILADQESYWKFHAQHHRLAGTKEDPDLPNYQTYPVSKVSLRRKFLRDITGQTGIKILIGTFRQGRDLFALNNQGQKPSLVGPLLFNGLMFLVLLLLGHGWLYLLWVVAYLTTYMLFARIRQIAEHGAIPDPLDLDPRRHTRSTLARWWERFLIAPNHVHYHLEHHLYASVPPYRLAALHRRLKDKGFYEGVDFPVGYRQVLKQVVKN